MRFLADESCDFAVVRAQREAGHDVEAVKDVLQGAPDHAVIDRADREAGILLTEDKDFGQLVFSGALNSPGVIFIRFPGSARQEMTSAVVKFVDDNADKIAQRFIVVQPGRIRISRR